MLKEQLLISIPVKAKMSRFVLGAARPPTTLALTSSTADKTQTPDHQQGSVSLLLSDSVELERLLLLEPAAAVARAGGRISVH